MISALLRLRRRPEQQRFPLLLFLALTLLLAGVATWVLAQHYVSDFTLHRYSKVIGVLDAEEFRVEHFGMLYPHMPIYLLSLLRILPGASGLYASHFLAVLCVAGMLALWEMHLRRKGYPRQQRLLLVALMASHPFVLWSGTSGLHNALTLAGFYLFCYACYLVVYVQDVRAMAFLAMVMAAFYFIDERALYIFVALLPLIPILASRRMAEESITSVYGVLTFPLLLSVCTWMYLNWIFADDPLTFLYARDSAFRGAAEQSMQSDWLQQWGGLWLEPVGVALVGGMLAFPGTLWLCYRWRQRPRLVAASLVLVIHPIIAIGLSTSGFFLGSVIGLLNLLAASTMGCLLMLPRVRRGGVAVMGLMLAGSAAGWLLLFQERGSEVAAWRESLLGRVTDEPYAEERALGLWLREHDMPTLLDDRTFYRAIAARGHGRSLILPYSARFKSEVQRRVPDVVQVVVANPRTPEGRVDGLCAQYPRLYYEGWPGYELVYDTPRWRVYRRDHRLRQGWT